MHCPKCGCSYFKTVYASDNQDCDTNVIFKKRQCDDCGRIWKTVEVYAEDYYGKKPSKNPLRASESPSPADRTDAAYEFRNRKTKALQAAKELCYGQNVVDQIQEATSTYRIDQILKAARKASLDV